MASDENFPVASLFLSSSIRQEVMVFYRFARHADDIADHPDLAVPTKVSKLNELYNQTDNPYLRDLLKAFRQDCHKTRYQTWEELLEYCRFSANPVGRFLLDIHGDFTPDAAQASDALCSVLQILNHLQDCQKDFLKMDRIYLPKEPLAEGYAYENLLVKNQTDPALKGVFDHIHLKCHELIEQSAHLGDLVTSKRFKWQVRMTQACAKRLLAKLEKNDPLTERVELTKTDKIALALKGIFTT